MVLPRFVDCALKGEPLLVYGDGEQSRCFCHVYDTVRALRGLADCDAVVGEVVNIGTRRSTTINALAELIVSRLESSSTIKHIPYEEAYEAGFEDMRRRMPNISKVNKFIGWAPTLSLEEIIDDVAKSVRSAAQ
jgi:UDP-glucose 4-epimerase